jgi:hypothetical protein
MVVSKVALTFAFGWHCCGIDSITVQYNCTLVQFETNESTAKQTVLILREAGKAAAVVARVAVAVAVANETHLCCNLWVLTYCVLYGKIRSEAAGVRPRGDHLAEHRSMVQYTACALPVPLCHVNVELL